MQQWIKLVTYACLSAIPILFAVLLKLESFPTHIHGFYLDDAALSSPSVPESLSGPVLLLICVVVPIVGIALSQLPTIPSDPYLYFMPFLGSFLTLILTDALKCMTGELRPCFLALCKVNTSIEVSGNYVNSTISPIICTGKEALDGRHSFPSSHCSQV